MKIEYTPKFLKKLHKYSIWKDKIISTLEQFKINPNHPGLRIEKMNPKTS